MNNAILFEALARERRAVRGFLPQPVPQATLEAIFRTAQFAPSNCNVQPWRVHVVSGNMANRMRTTLQAAAASSAPFERDYPSTDSYRGDDRLRQIEAAKALLAAQGIDREDIEGRDRSFLRNFRFFDAPHAAFVFLNEGFGIREAVDCGIFAQTLMLALTANGLASCPQTALSFHADRVRTLLNVSATEKLLFGLAFGYEDAMHPVNAARTGRMAVDEATVFHQ